MKITSKAKKILKTFPCEVQKYFFLSDRKLSKLGYELVLTHNISVNLGGGRCSGYYDGDGKVLKVALGKGWEHSFCVFLHEMQHHAQKMDPKSIWHTKISDNHTKFFQWLAGKNFKEPRILAMSAMILERDAERRALTEIRKKYSHIIDPESYGVRANTYLASYLWCYNHRSWLKKTPYNRKLMAHCPPKLFRSFADIPENLELAMERFL